MGVDPFAALGVEAPNVSPVAPPVAVKAKGGIDPFAALGIDKTEQFQPTPSAPGKPPYGGFENSWRTAIGQGIRKGVIGGISSLIDPIARLGDTRPFDTGGTGQLPPGPVERLLTSIGGPSDVEPTTRGAQITQSAAQGAAGIGLLGPLMGGGSGLGAIARQGLQGAVGGGLGDVAAQAAPEPLKPVANLLGNLVGAGGAGAAAEGAAAATRGTLGAGGRMGIGPKQDINGIRATESQVQAAGAKARDILGPEGQQALEQFGQTETQARDLEAKIASADTSPADRMMAQKQLQTIQSQREQLVPGAQPTTAQLVPTEKTVAYERDMRTLNNPQFAGRDTANNKAMAGAVQSMAPAEAAPAAVGDLLRQRLAEIDTAGQAAAGRAGKAVGAATEALGATGTPEAIGAAVRQTPVAMNRAAKAREKALWEAIDPEGKLALPLGQVQETARGLLKDMQPGLGDVANSQEMQILSGASGLPSVVPFRDAQRLRSNIGFAERALRAQPGNEQSLRRLGLLKTSLDGAIADAAEGAAATDPALAGRLAGLGGENGPVLGEGSGAGLSNGGSGAGAAGGATGVPGPGGVQRQGQGGPGGAQSNRGVAAGPTDHLPGDLTDLEKGIYADLTPTPSKPPLEPNFDTEAADNYAAAREATLERKTTFGQGPMGQILQQGPNAGAFKIEDAAVPRQFLTGNAVEPARVRQYINDVGGNEQAVAAMRDALVSDLQTKGIVQDGEVKATPFANWLHQHGRTIDMFPGLREKLGTVQQAQTAFDEAQAAHVKDVKDFQTGVAKNFLNDDPQVASAKIFTSANPSGTARQLYDLVKGDPDALAGLRRGVVNHLAQRFNMEINDVDPLAQKSFRDFVDKNRNPLKIIFGGQGAQNIDLVEGMLNRTARAKQAEATLGSNTAQKALGAVGHGAGHGAGQGMRTTLFAILGEHLGSQAASLMGHHGMVGLGAGALGAAGGYYLSQLRRAGINTMNDLGREMMLNPELARTLARKVPPEGAFSPGVRRQIAGALQASAQTASTNERKAQ